MARKFSVTIDSILNGQQTAENISGKGQFNFSRGIDPDVSMNQASGAPKSSGVISPVKYQSFSGANVTESPIAIITTPKDALVYTVLENGRLISYSSTLASETLIGTVTGSVAGGGFYYNNYIYIPTGTDVSRYGPLDGTPALANTWWTVTAGLTALTNTTYPGKSNVSYPNHWGHVHSDNQAYFFDFKNGQGLIHSIKTTKGTDEGDTDDGSAYNVLDLPFGYLPTDIESYGTDLVISAIQTTDTTLAQGPSALFFWDPTDTDSFYRQVELPEFPLVTALQNKGGSIYVFSGNRNNGHAVGVYDGAFGIIPIEFFADGTAPLAGAVGSYGNRVVWGTESTQVSTVSVVRALGYKSPRMPSQAINTIAQGSATGTNPVISALNYVQQASGILPRMVIGSLDTTPTYSLDKIGGNEGADPIMEFGPFNVGEPFKITKVRIPVGATIGGISVTPTLLFDDKQDSYPLAVINNTNYSGNRNVVYTNPELTKTQSTVQAQGQHNFSLRLTFGGASTIPILLPILVELETIDD